MPTIDEQVEVLMSGTAYGDPETKKNMAKDLRERLIQAEKEGRPLRVYAGYDPRTALANRLNQSGARTVLRIAAVR